MVRGRASLGGIERGIPLRKPADCGCSPRSDWNRIADISRMPWIFTRGNEYEEVRLCSIGLDANALKTVELGSSSHAILAAIQE